MDTITKEELIEKLHQIREMGWIKSTRPGNSGAVGNTLEDLLGLKENNLPIPNAAEWELKAQRVTKTGRTRSYTSLFHMEPSPRVLRFVPQILLPKYGWRHKEAGQKHPDTELSFRQTINAASRTNRGFGIIVDRAERKIVVSFNASAASWESHAQWLSSVEERIGLSELDPCPYWGFDDLFHAAGVKLHNCFYVHAQTKKVNGEEYFLYSRMFMLQRFSLDGFIDAFENGSVLVDFDASSGHNHGTKFRMRGDALLSVYETVSEF